MRYVKCLGFRAHYKLWKRAEDFKKTLPDKEYYAPAQDYIDRGLHPKFPKRTQNPPTDNEFPYFVGSHEVEYDTSSGNLEIGCYSVVEENGIKKIHLNTQGKWDVLSLEEVRDIKLIDETLPTNILREVDNS